jgi:hypothetical protein
MHYDGAKPQNCIVEKLPWMVKVYYPCRAEWKKTFLSTSNVIISQSVWSTFAKHFAHVLLSSLGQDLAIESAKK